MDAEITTQAEPNPCVEMANTAKLLALRVEERGGVAFLLDATKAAQAALEFDREADKLRANPEQWEAFKKGQMSAKMLALMETLDAHAEKLDKIAPAQTEADALREMSHAARVSASRAAAPAVVGQEA